MARALRSPFDVSRSTVVAAAIALIPRLAMTPMTRRTAVRADAAVDTVNAQAQAVTPSRARAGGVRTAAPRRVTTAGEVMGLPRGELQRAGDQDDHAHRISAAITVTSSALVFVVSSPPDAGLVAPLRPASAPPVQTPEPVQPPCRAALRAHDDAA